MILNVGGGMEIYGAAEEGLCILWKEVLAFAGVCMDGVRDAWIGRVKRILLLRPPNLKHTFLSSPRVHLSLRVKYPRSV